MLFFVRYVLPVLFTVGAIVMAIVAPTTPIALEGLAMGLGAAISIALFNVIWRLGFSGDRERAEEEAARRYLVEHGHWPDEAPTGRAARTVVPR